MNWIIFTSIVLFLQNAELYQKAPNNSDSYNTIEFVRDLTYGDTEEVLLGVIDAVSVDPYGRVYLADRNQTIIHVFHPDGSYKTAIGRQGRGPGEFIDINMFTRINIDSENIYVYGTEWMFSDRVHVFSLEDFSLQRTMMFRDQDKTRFDEDLENYYPSALYPLKDGNFIVAYGYVHWAEYLVRGENKILYYVHDQTGIIASGPVFEQKDRTYLYQVYEGGRGYNYHAFPFFGKSLFAVSGNGLIYTAQTEEFRLDVYDSNGQHQFMIEHPFEAQELTRNGLLRMYEEIDLSRLDFHEGEDTALQMIHEADNLPETWPALNDLLIDDENRLWVSTIVEDFDIYEWWVLEETGELITRFEWPRDEPIEMVKNGYIYTRETDEETGLQQIVRYRIEMEEV